MSFTIVGEEDCVQGRQDSLRWAVSVTVHLVFSFPSLISARAYLWCGLRLAGHFLALGDPQRACQSCGVLYFPLDFQKRMCSILNNLPLYRIFHLAIKLFSCFVLLLQGRVYVILSLLKTSFLPVKTGYFQYLAVCMVTTTCL